MPEQDKARGDSDPSSSDKATIYEAADDDGNKIAGRNGREVIEIEGQPEVLPAGPAGAAVRQEILEEVIESCEVHCAICFECPPCASNSTVTTSPSFSSEAASSNNNFNTTTSTLCRRDGFAHLPCCGGNNNSVEQTSTTRICTNCLLLLCSPSTIGGPEVRRIGCCPRCRHWLSVEMGAESNNEGAQEGGNDISNLVTIRTLTHVGTCCMCRQVRQLVDQQQHRRWQNINAICDACYFGMTNPLLYECNSCHLIQRISHPMYRYQRNGMHEFGTVSWSCHRRCLDYTMWRILPSQVG